MFKRFEKPALSFGEIAELERMARSIRGDVLKMTTLAQSGHPGGSFSSTEMFLTVYRFARVFPKDPFHNDRDRVVVSHGHTSPGVYATLAHLGFFETDAVISGFRHVNSPFEGHITRGIPGIEWTTGNLGQGLSAGVGFALAAKVKKQDVHAFVLMSDAEQAKGQVSEARRTAVKYGLSNLTVLVDDNDAQISGRAKDIMYVDIAAGYRADGWNVMQVNGHDVGALYAAVHQALQDPLKPTAILCKTQIGHGVSFMENEVSFHGKPLSEKQLQQALDELGVENDLAKFRALREKLPHVPHETKYLEYTPHIETGKAIVYDASSHTDNRSAFGAALADLGMLNREQNTPVALVDCDLMASVKTAAFLKNCPRRFFQLGVAEHNAAATAGALSADGVVTFFADFGVFGVDETYNQQRLNDINHANLKVAVTHVGTDVGEDGKTHHCIDYVGGPANFFHFQVVVPADPNQTDRAVREMARQYGNFLLAMGRSKQRVLTKPDGTPFFGGEYSFSYGGVDQIRSCESAELVVVAMGAVVIEAQNAVDQLREEGLQLGLLNVSCPLALWKQEKLLRDCLQGKTVLSVEDHNVWTGLGAMLQDALFRNAIPIHSLHRLGVDTYAPSGSREDLYAHFGLDAPGIARKVREITRT